MRWVKEREKLKNTSRDLQIFDALIVKIFERKIRKQSNLPHAHIHSTHSKYSVTKSAHISIFMRFRENMMKVKFHGKKMWFLILPISI